MVDFGISNVEPGLFFYPKQCISLHAIIQFLLVEVESNVSLTFFHSSKQACNLGLLCDVTDMTRRLYQVYFLSHCSIVSCFQSVCNFYTL